MIGFILVRGLRIKDRELSMVLESMALERRGSHSLGMSSKGIII